MTNSLFEILHAMGLEYLHHVAKNKFRVMCYEREHFYIVSYHEQMQENGCKMCRMERRIRG
jgi:hypothetical protein